MRNPFEEKTAQFEFFNQMTYAINQWMLEKYPEFDQSLTIKMRRLDEMQVNIETNFKRFEDFFLEERKRSFEILKEEINKYMSISYPDLGNELKETSKKLKHSSNLQEKNQKEIKESLKKIVSSQSLAEEVFKVKDDLKIIKKWMDIFCDNWKNIIKATEKLKQDP